MKKGNLIGKIFGIALGVTMIVGMLSSSPIFISQVEASPATIYVPDNYSTIQAAVNASSPGDTIIVRDGTYIENVNVNKDYLTIQSENGAETTIVQPGYPTSGSYPPGHAVFSISDIGEGSEEVYGVTVSGFTIEETKLPPEEDYCDSDDTAAFSLYKAHECEISSNRIVGTGYSANFGIKLQRSSSNSIISNNVENGSLFIIDGSYFDEETGSLVDRGCHDNAVENNTVNGKPLVYLENASSQTVTDAGQVILINCDDITVQDLQLSNVYNGIELLTTNSSKIVGNTIEQDFGTSILLNCSLNNEISTNNITVECGTGIGIVRSCDNIIAGNNISIFQQHTDYSGGGNAYQAIDLSASDDNTVETNLINVNNYVGIQIQSSLRNEVNNNTMHSYSNHGGTGIRMCLSSDNTVTSNELNDVDIVLGSCWSGPPPPPHSVENTVDNNRILGTRGGLYIYPHPNQADAITNNTFTDCGIHIYTWALEESSLYHHIIEGNTVNNKPLVYLENESEQTINDAGQVILVNCQDITVEGSNLIGIQFWASADSRIANNNISLNWTHGIIFFQSSNNEVEGNTISLHIYGLQIIDSQNNRITKNEIVGNEVGLYITDSQNNRITKNEIVGNVGGLSIIGSSNNEIYLNDFIENTFKNSFCDTDANTWSSPEEITYIYNGNTYTSYLGNYWSDYTGSDANGDGIGDTPYSINSDADNYPLMEPFVGLGLCTLTISSTAGGNVAIPGEGIFLYGNSTAVNLVALTAPDYQFVNWTGDGGTIAGVEDATTTISMLDDYSITANFKAISPCFIATAAYGTPMAEEIEILREFRDEYLITNPLGQAFVDFYYRTSPPMAEFITEHTILKPIVRTVLVPAVVMSTVAVNTTLAEKAAIAGLVALVSVALAVWATRQRDRSPEYT